MLAPRAEPRWGKSGRVAPPPCGHMDKASLQPLGCLGWPKGGPASSLLPGELPFRRKTLVPLEFSPVGRQWRGGC